MILLLQIAYFFLATLTLLLGVFFIAEHIYTGIVNEWRKRRQKS